jgi:hypothetical protein
MTNHHGEKFVVFTNDIPYARSLFPTTPIIEESEVDTLLLMSRAKGCICANSSFSWWGAYLNPGRPIYFPSKWFNDPSMDISGFFFEGSYIQKIFDGYSVPRLQPPPKFPDVPAPKSRVPIDFHKQTPSLNFLFRR